MCQSFTSEMIARVNRSRRQSLNVSIIHTFNEPPLPAREGGIDAEFFTRGAKREEDGKDWSDHTTYEEYAMPRKKVRSVFQQPRSTGVGPPSWSSSRGKATQAWRNKKKPSTPKGWKPYGK